MIRVRIKIGSGSIVDTADTYGLVYLDSDKRVGAEQKEFEATSYPEEEGEHIIPKTVDAPFDYKAKFSSRQTRWKTPTRRLPLSTRLCTTRRTRKVRRRITRSSSTTTTSATRLSDTLTRLQRRPISGATPPTR